VLEAPDDRSLVGVARDFALAEGPLRGPLHRVTEPPLPPETPRYHAPRWARPGAPLRLFDVAEEGALSHTGPGAGTLQVRFRIPPDLFPWPREVVPLELTYGQTTPPGQPAPSLAAELNGQWLGTLPPPGPDGLRTEVLMLRRELLRGYNELYFHVDPSAGEICGPSDEEAARTFVDGRSSLHIEATPLFAPMPDVGKLVDDGFPFTRRADLGETVLVLPDPPSPEDLAAALSMTAHFAAVTGQVGARVRAMSPAEVTRAGELDADLLVVGASGLQPLLARWASRLPLDATTPGRLTVRGLSPWAAIDAVMRGRNPIEEAERAEAALGRPGTTSVLMQVESPLHRERVAVFVTAPVRRDLPSLGDLLGHAESRYPDSDLLVRGDHRLTMHRLGAGFHTGSLEGIDEVRWALASRFVVLVPCSILGALLMAFAMGRSIRVREQRRLSVPELEGDA
jgi:cellulose synthase (UDP-forming)